MKQKLYIMCGLPFSGKTTLAKKISQQTGAEYIASDDLHDASLPKIERWGAAIDLMKTRVEQTLKEGRGVVCDNGNYRKSQRDELYGMAREMGAETVVIFLDLPTEILRQRSEENTSRPGVAEETFARHETQIEIPTDNEGVVVRLKSEGEIQAFDVSVL